MHATPFYDVLHDKIGRKKNDQHHGVKQDWAGLAPNYFYQFFLVCNHSTCHTMLHHVGLEILKTDNSSLPARRLIISFVTNEP